MLFNQKLAMAVKVNGKILREFNDTVYVPYGSEYTLLLKNLDTKRVQLNLAIDGQSMAENLVIQPGKEIDLERSIVNGNLNAGNRFKFIERTSSIENNRGIKLEDGIIRVEYQFEHVYNHSWHNDHAWSKTIFANPLEWNAIYSATSAIGPMAAVGSNSVTRGMTSNNVSYDAGITVPGSISNQKFSTVAAFPLENTKHSMVIKLLGQTPNNKLVAKEVTVKAKPRCVTCNHQNKATAKFCSQCGTSLEIIS